MCVSECAIGTFVPRVSLNDKDIEKELEVECDW